MTAAPDPNASDQAAAWNGAMGERWLTLHDRLDRMLTPFGDAILETAGDVSGLAVVDVGCGTGEASARIADRAGPAGRVLGLDISERLTDHARQAQQRPGLDFVTADAATVVLGFPADLIISRFGMMFFPEPEVAFGHLRSCLAPNGRLVTVVWQAPDRNEWVRRPLHAAASVVDLPPPPPVNAPGPFALADPDRLEGLLVRSGFTRIAIQPCLRDVTIGAGALETARFLLNVLPTGPLLDELPEEQAEALVDVVTASLDEVLSVDRHDGEDEVVEDVVYLGAAAHLVVAQP